MMKDDENLMCLRYSREGSLLSRLPLETMISVLGLYFMTGTIYQKLVSGSIHSLEGGGWLELENRHC